MIALALLALVDAAEPLATWDFEADDGGLSTLGDPEAQWEWGSFPPSYGPGMGLTGARGWATRLEAPYFNEVEAGLGLPAWPLADLSRPMLELVHWHALDAGDVAALVLDAEGRTIEPVYGYPSGAGFSGRSGGWVVSWFELSEVDALEGLSLRLISDASVQMAGWYIDELSLADGDIAPPLLEDLRVPEDTEDIDGPWPVEVLAFDNDGPPSLTLHYTVGLGGEQATLMTAAGDGRYVAELPGPVPPGTTLSVRVRATDGANVTWLPDEGAASFRVRLPAPTDLRGPEGRVADTEAALEWTPPASDKQVLGYRVYRGEQVLFDCSEPWALVPLAGGGADVYAVSGVYEAGEGDLSEPLALSVSLPEVLAVSPPVAWQGDRVRLNVLTRNLLMAQGALEAGLGEGVEVVEVDVHNVDEASLVLAIAEDAALGERDLDLRSGAVRLLEPGAFEVLDGADRPRLRSVQPAVLRQGESATLTLRSSGAFAELPLVDLGPGVLVESVQALGLDELAVQVVVEPRAALGTRPVVVDDGARLWQGVDFRVRDAVPATTGTCGGGAGGFWLAALLLVGARRRRA